MADGMPLNARHPAPATFDDPRQVSNRVAPPVYHFDRFQLDAGERQLLADGAAVAIPPRAFDLLTVLVERAGKPVSKGELLDRVWPNLVVEENNLQVQVSALRKILGAQAIVTIPGHTRMASGSWNSRH